MRIGLKMRTKSCTHKSHGGKRELPITEFSRHPATKDGYQSICKKCNLKLANRRSRKLSLRKKKMKGKDSIKDYKVNHDYKQKNYDVKDIPSDAFICDV